MTAKTSGAFWLRVAFAWLVVAICLLIKGWPAIAAMQPIDPDDALRLVQVRDLLAGQGWFDLAQHRISPSQGVAMHWSRLVDLPLAGMILLLRPLLGPGLAEQVTATLIPLLTLLCAMLLSARIALHLFGERAALLGAVLWVTALAAISQLQPMRIDHHGWQIVAVLAAANGLLARSARTGGWIAGTALAFGLSISLELMPVVLLFAGVFALRWLREHDARGWLVHMLLALAAASAGFFLVTRGFADLATYCDAISPAWLVGLVAAAAMVTGIAKIPETSQPLLIGLLGVAAALTAASFLLLAPQCQTGPFAALDPLVRQVWYDNVLEGRPVWRQDLPNMLQMVGPSLVGVAVLGWGWLNTRGERRALIGDLALLLAGLVAVAALVARSSAFAAALATVPLGWFVAAALRRAAQQGRPGRRLLVLPALFVALLPGVAAGKLNSVTNAPKATGTQTGNPAATRGCSLPGSLPAFLSVSHATIFAPFDVGPILLVETPHSVIATGHHRASASMRDTIDAYLAAPDQAEAIVRRHQADYIIACGDLIEAQNYRTFAPDGLMARLLVGKSPDWLEPVKLPTAAGELKMWKVKPAVQGKARKV